MLVEVIFLSQYSCIFCIIRRNPKKTLQDSMLEIWSYPETCPQGNTRRQCLTQSVALSTFSHNRMTSDQVNSVYGKNVQVRRLWFLKLSHSLVSSPGLVIIPLRYCFFIYDLWELDQIISKNPQGKKSLETNLA